MPFHSASRWLTLVEAAPPRLREYFTANYGDAAGVVESRLD